MRVEKSLELLGPAGIRHNIDEQCLDDQCDHIKTIIANAACLSRHGQFRLDGEFSIPQAIVMRADVADCRQSMEPAHKDRLWLIECTGYLLPHKVGMTKCRRKITLVCIAEDAHRFENAQHFIARVEWPGMRENAIVLGLQLFGHKAGKRVEERWLFCCDDENLGINWVRTHGGNSCLARSNSEKSRRR